MSAPDEPVLIDDRRWVLEFQLTDRELSRFVRLHVWRHSPRARWILLVFAVAIPAITGLAYLFPGAGVEPAASAWATFLVLVLFSAVVLPLAFSLSHWLMVRASRAVGATAPQVVELSAEALGSRRPGVSETRRQWGAIGAVEETPDLICIYVNRYQALALPRRAFSSPAEAEACVQAIGEWREQALQGTPPEGARAKV